jgi:glucose-1-phosphate adenylyltransferase
MKVMDCPAVNPAMGRRRIAASRVVAFVLAGGEGTRLHPLTASQCKPALPFAYGFRIVDFVLSNLVNSGISTIYVLAQYKPDTLIRHIETVWAPWARRPGACLKVVLPKGLCGQYRGTADAVHQNLDLIERHRPDLVAVFAADHVYRMDLGQMLEFHRERRAELTIGATQVPIQHASSFGLLMTAPDRRVLAMQEKPERPTPIPNSPRHAYASMGNYLFEPAVLAETLEHSIRQGGTDFGRDILPRLPEQRRVFAYDLQSNHVPGLQRHEERGYWRDVGTLHALAAARQDVLGPKPRFNPWNDWWPVYGEARALPMPMVVRAGRARRMADTAGDLPAAASLPAMPALPAEQRTEASP